MLHAAHTTKKTWWRNIIRYFATTSLPYVLHYADDGSQHIMRDIMHGTKVRQRAA